MDQHEVQRNPQSTPSHGGQLSGGHVHLPLGQRQNLSVPKVVPILALVFVFLFTFVTMGGAASLGLKLAFASIAVLVVLVMCWFINHLFPSHKG